MTRDLHAIGLVLVGYFGAGVVGCNGKETTDAGHVTGSVRNSEFATQYAASFCQGISSCCAANAIAFDSKSCESSLAAQANAVLAARMADPKITYDADAATRCINSIHDANVACTDREQYRSADDPCDFIFRGTVPLGGACSENAQCESAEGQRVRCDQGVCTIETSTPSMGDGPHAKLGEPCASTCTNSANGGWGCTNAGNSAPTIDASCWTDEGLYCGNAGSCVAVPNLGEACALSNYCPMGAYCSGGTCVAQLSSGSCASNTSACSASSYCDTTSQQCTPKKSDGSACDQDSECLGGDCYGDRCRVWSVANSASCAGLLDD